MKLILIASLLAASTSFGATVGETRNCTDALNVVTGVFKIYTDILIGCQSATGKLRTEYERLAVETVAHAVNVEENCKQQCAGIVSTAIYCDLTVQLHGACGE